MFMLRDPEIYNELWDVAVNAPVARGAGVVRQDVFGFYFNAVTAAMITAAAGAGVVVALVYKARQAEADKEVGTGEAIISGDRLYYIVATGLVSPNPVGVVGTDCYPCGYAKFSATADETTVIMEFDGTRYNENI